MPHPGPSRMRESEKVLKTNAENWPKCFYSLLFVETLDGNEGRYLPKESIWKGNSHSLM